MSSDVLPPSPSDELARFDQLWDELDRLQHEAATSGKKEDEDPSFLLKRIKAQSDLIEAKRQLLLDRAKLSGSKASDYPLGLVILEAEVPPQ